MLEKWNISFNRELMIKLPIILDKATHHILYLLAINHPRLRVRSHFGTIIVTAESF